MQDILEDSGRASSDQEMNAAHSGALKHDCTIQGCNHHAVQHDSIGDAVSIVPVEGVLGRFTSCISLSVEDISAQVRQWVMKKSQNFKMKGFRKGKVPFQYVMEAYQSEAYEEVVKHLVGQTFDSKVLPNLPTQLLGILDISEMPATDQENKTIDFQIMFEVMPVYDVSLLSAAKVMQHEIKLDLLSEDFLASFQRVLCYLSGAAFDLSTNPQDQIHSYDVLTLSRTVSQDGQSMPQWFSDGVMFPMVPFAANTIDQELYQEFLSKQIGYTVTKEIDVPDLGKMAAEFKVLEIKKAFISDVNQNVLDALGSKKTVEEFKASFSAVLSMALPFLVSRQNDQRLLQEAASFLDFKIPETVRRKMKAEIWKDLNYTIKGQTLDASEVSNDIVNKELDSVIDERFYLICFVDMLAQHFSISMGDEDLKKYIHMQSLCSWDADAFLDRLDQNHNFRQTISMECLASMVADKIRDLMILESSELSYDLLLGYATHLGNFKS